MGGTQYPGKRKDILQKPTKPKVEANGRIRRRFSKFTPEKKKSHSMVNYLTHPQKKKWGPRENK